MAAESLTPGRPIQPARQLFVIALLALLAGCQRAQQISPGDLPAFEVSLTTAAPPALAWHGGLLANDALYLQPLDAHGKASGKPLQLTDGTNAAYEADLQSVADGWLLAWYEKQPADKSLMAFLADYDSAGRLRWKRALSAPGSNSRNTVVRSTGQQIHVAWIETRAGEMPAVWTARFDQDGKPLAAPMRIAAASTDTWTLNAALDEAGNFYVVYDATLGTQGKELQLLRIDGDQVRQRRLSADDGRDSVYPDIAFSGSRVALTWFDSRDGNEEVYLYTTALATLLNEGDVSGVRITRTPGASIGAYLAWNGAKLGLAWCDPIEGQNEIYFASFNAEGRPLAATQRLTRTATQSSIPSIRPWEGGFAIAWNEYQLAAPGEGHGGIASSTAMLQIVE